MKFETEKSPTSTHGMEKSRAFRFEFNETMFKMLSSTTYSDPIRAVIRELACNSSDAHVMAGNEKKPFEIHLPTSHEPEFIIRDYGVGMDGDEIDELFAMYGGSSKRNSNDTIGALGIGSKSPYAYTQMYNVVTTKNGVTRTYVAHVENGMPRLTLSGVHQTPDAPNGVTVQFPVKEKDIWEFHNKAKIALEFFEPMPKVNDSGFAPHKQSYILKTDQWGLRKEARTAAHGYTCRAIMGKVQYQVGGIDESRTNSLQKKILEMPIDMFFPLGSLEFATSRETLQLSEKTIAAVLGMCDKIVEEAIQQVKDKIDACKEVWEAQLLLFSLLNETKNTYGNSAGMSELIKEALQKGRLYGQYKNFVLNEQHAVVNMLAYSNIHVTKFEYNSRAQKRSKKEPFIAPDPKTLKEDKRIAKATGDPLVIARNRFEITVKPDVLFVINDTDKPGDKYIHYLVQESGSRKTVLMVHRPKGTETELASMLKNAKKLMADIGNPPVKMMSELVVAYAPIFAQRRPTGSRGQARQIAVLKSSLESRRRYTQKGWTKAWRTPEDAEIVPGNKKYYVVIEKLVATECGFDDAWDLREFVDYVVSSGKFGIDRSTPIFGVRKNNKVLKNNNGEWVELTQHVYDRVNEIMTPQKTLALSLHLTPFNDDMHELLNYLASKQPLTNSPAQCFAVALAEAKGVRFDNWSAFKWVLNVCSARGKYSEGDTVDFNEKWQAIKKGYPMLEFVGSYSVRGNVKTLVDYIRQVDEQNFREANALAAASNQ